MKAPICVVGANSVGLTCALLLAKRGVDVRLIDSRKTREYHSESILLFPSTLELFEKIHLAEAILKKGIKVEHFKFFKSNQIQIDLEFSKLQTPYPFICALSQEDFEEILIQELMRLSVPIERGVSLKEIKQVNEFLHIKLALQDEEEEFLSVSYLVGCDGSNSKVRKLAQIKEEHFGWTHHYLMADVMLHWNEKPTTVAGFEHPHGYVMILPIKGNHYRIVCDLKNEKKYAESSLSHFKKVLMQKVPAHLDLEDIEWLSSLSFQYSQAKVYRKDRIFLTGDSAHTFSPIGGQSTNSGLGDVFNLCWKLALVYKNEARSVLLSSYSRERMPVMKGMLHNTRRILELASSSKIWERQIRDIVMFVFNKVETLKTKAMLRLAGYHQKYTHSPIMMKKRFLRFQKGIDVAEQVKDCWLIDQKNKTKMRFFELLSYYKHTVILYITKKQYALALEIKEHLMMKYPSLVDLHLFTSDKELKGNSLWLDESKQFLKHYHLGSHFIVIVRPDHYVAALSSLIDKEVISTYFKQFVTLRAH